MPHERNSTGSLSQCLQSLSYLHNDTGKCSIDVQIIFSTTKISLSQHLLPSFGIAALRDFASVHL